jgi:hypothetical protein
MSEEEFHPLSEEEEIERAELMAEFRAEIAAVKVQLKLEKERRDKENARLYPRALFGTDFHGAATWFCWRRGHGCPGVIGKPKDNPWDETHKEGVIVLPSGWMKLKDRSYGRHERAAFRTASLIDEKKQINRQRHWKIRNPKSAAMQQDQIRAFDAKRRDAILMAQRGERIEKRGIVWQGFLSVPVHCPSCGQISFIPSLRGAFDVRGGNIVK